MGIALLAPATAYAQCAPNPSQAGQAITCTGANSGGYTITTSASPLTVTSSGSITASGSALTVAIPPPYAYASRSATITVDGQITSASGSGILVLSGPSPTYYDYYGTSATITVAAGGSVSGVTGIALASSPGGLTANAPVSVSLDNAGTITGTGGVALAGGTNTAFYSITNEATGVIGAITAPFTSITNAGTINGGTLSAITDTPAGNYGASYITNTGVIEASTGSATIALADSVTNSGTITNTGGGAAIAGTGVYVTNNSGGVVTGGTYGEAIAATSSLDLFNSGTINGNVDAGPATTTYVDSTAGTINGDLTLGNGTNTLFATLQNGAIVTGVTGTITAGSNSTNTLDLSSSADATLGAVALPISFSTFEFTPASGTTLTLADGFSQTGTITMNGTGTLDNTTTLSGNGTVVSVNNFTGYTGTFENDGTISTSNVNGAAGVVVGGYNTLDNTGTIEASGTAVSIGYGTLNNSGTIRAGGDGVIADVQGFTNTGSITAGGIGLVLEQACSCSVTTNAGLIAGAVAGVQIVDGTLRNTGLIASSAIGIEAEYYGSVVNEVGGVISGGTAAINLTGDYGTGVSNAGTIDGNVNITSESYGYVFGAAYEAVTGGVLNGNLTLGPSATLITDLVNTGSGTFAGINGTVTATDASLLYNVESDATTTTSIPTGFVSIGYQVSNGASLTLDADSALTTRLTLAGSGTVTFDGSILTQNAMGIYADAYQTLTGNAVADALTIVNNGTVAVTSNQTGTYVPAAVMLDTGDSLVNNGAISFVNTTATSGLYAVTGGASIDNTGSITAKGGGAIDTSFGSYDFNVTNSGSITSDLAAITVGGAATIVNSGTITSSQQVAITATDYTGELTTVENLAGGMIKGSSDAIDLVEGMVDNAGTIVGDVDFGASGYGGVGIYVADGGTLNGNLILGGSTNALIETGSGYGVTGTVSALTGYGDTTGNFLGHLRTSDATVTLGGTLPTGFGSELTIASGAGTQVTLQGPSGYTGDIYVGGDGAIVNDVSTTGFVAGLTDTALAQTSYAALQLASFTNNASVAGIDLDTNALINTGTVGSTTMLGTVVAQSFVDTLAFANSGTIVSTPEAFLDYYFYSGLYIYPAVNIAGVLDGAGTVTNSGTISGGLAIDAITASAGNASSASLAITNSGTIAGTTVSLFNISTGVGVLVPYAIPAISASLLDEGTVPTSITLTNSGTITGDIDLAADSLTLSDAAGGTIVGNVSLVGANAGTNMLGVAGTLTGNVAMSGAAINTVAIGGTLAGGITLTGGTSNTVTVGGSLIGDLTFSDAGSDSATVTGAMIGTITGGSGTTAIALDGGFAGAIDGGTGTTSLAVAGGTTTAPIEFTTLSNIASYTQTGGVATVSGTANLGSATIGGGDFIGLVGSTITVPLITVAKGGTFSSGGTVDGNLAVSGTLHPGASPDAMTVNGNVALAGGSTTVFEVSPAASAKLVVSGQVLIASGATLQITPLQVVMPGTTLQLISAAGGITGDYSTVTGIAGALHETTDGLALTVLYDTTAPQTRQVARSIAYVNTILTNGGASTALLAGLSSLTTSTGAASANAFARVTPEAYASALQIGVENGLLLSRAARDIDPDTAPHSGHVFTFAQEIGNWRGMNGSASAGTSSANISGSGVLGGVGVDGEIGGGHAALAVFGGYLDETQDIGGLGASTTARGFAGGVTARVESGPAQLAVSALLDQAHARTTRALPDGSSALGGYTLHSWTIDAQLSAQIALSAAWAVRPHVGTTWIHTTRSAIDETGSSPFDLDVARETHKAGFVDGGFRLESTAASTSRFSPYVDLGVRWQAQGRAVGAVAGFVDENETLYASGTRRSPASALVAAGASYRLTQGISLFATGHGEIARHGSSADVMGGVRVAF